MHNPTNVPHEASNCNLLVIEDNKKDASGHWQSAGVAGSRLAMAALVVLALATGAASDPHRAGQIVFPSSGDQSYYVANKMTRHQRQQPLIYVNPQPSTLSGKYQMAAASSDLQSSQSGAGGRNRAAPTFAQAASFYQPPIARDPNGAAGSQHHQQPPRFSSSSSSIGKSEKSQVAEWPFFKSFQAVRNSQLSNQLQFQPLPGTATTSASSDRPISTTSMGGSGADSASSTAWQAVERDSTETTAATVAATEPADDEPDRPQPSVLESAATSQDGQASTERPPEVSRWHGVSS